MHLVEPPEVGVAERVNSSVVDITKGQGRMTDKPERDIRIGGVWESPDTLV
jgi:hypothetical protein